MVEPIPPNFILPAGSQVVTTVTASGPRGCYPEGTACEVVKSPTDPTHSYRVRFVDGFEASLLRREFVPLRDAQSGALPQDDLSRFVIYRCVVGSRAYGLAKDDSDTDRRGFFLPPAELHWSVYGIPEQIEDKANEECYWELGKFITLALKANPNILECLYTPLVEHAIPLAQELLAKRGSFLSKIAYQTYNGYVMSQFKRLNQSIAKRAQPNWKNAMHTIRLLISGLHLVRHGEPLMEVGDLRDPLLGIQRGERTWEEIDAWRLELHEEFEAAYLTTKLPDRPDYEAANEFLVRARREAMTLWNT